MPAKYLALPSLGVWMGSGATPNIEEVLSVNPGVILCFWSVGAAGVQMADAIQKQSGLPVVLVDYDVRSTARTFSFLGALLGREERGRVLAAYCRQKLAALRAAVAAVPRAQRKSVFVAEGTGGLESDPVGSLHVQDTFDLLGLRNVVALPGTQGKGMGMPTVSMEQLMAWQPDAILVSEYAMSDTRQSDLYDEIRGDSLWRDLQAVRGGEVFRIPQSPFALDRAATVGGAPAGLPVAR